MTVLVIQIYGVQAPFALGVSGLEPLRPGKGCPLSCGLQSSNTAQLVLETRARAQLPPSWI